MMRLQLLGNCKLAAYDERCGSIRRLELGPVFPGTRPGMILVLPLKGRNGERYL
jgi:hypothetical protein